MDCIFCKIINGELPSKKIYEDELVYAFMDIDPTVDGHVLLIPKKHYTDFMELDDDIIIHMNKVRKELTKMLMEKLNVKALSISFNYGDSQVVKHFHMHLLPNLLISAGAKNTVDEIYKKISN